MMSFIGAYFCYLVLVAGPQYVSCAEQVIFPTSLDGNDGKTDDPPIDYPAHLVGLCIRFVGGGEGGWEREEERRR